MEPGTAIRLSPERQRVDEWAVVLAAAGIPHWQRRRADGWALLVEARDAAPALEALEAYEREAATAAEPPAAVQPSCAAIAAGVVAVLLIVGFFAVTGARAGRSVWFERGSADAALIVAGQWWRVLTALTLHADAPHLLGNAAAGALLLPAVFGQLGPGIGLWLVLAAGAAGNGLTAAVHRTGHVSVGASTAMFGAIGVLAGIRLVSGGRRAGPLGRRWVAVAAALGLLALLGVAPDADVLAHLFGALAGGALGAAAARLRAGHLPPPAQWLLAAAGAAAVAGAWRAAL